MAYKTIQFKEDEIKRIRKLAKRLKKNTGSAWSDREVVMFAITASEGSQDNFDKEFSD